MQPREIAILLGFILLCELAGAIGSLFTFPGIANWYAYLEKPSFSPPDWLFAPVWILLYLLMGISAHLIFRSKSPASRNALSIFAIQLVLNVCWSFAFFGLFSSFYGFLVIMLLWAAIILTILYFYKISKPAAYLLVPYLLWVTFAMILNYSIMVLN
ncbi:MAG: tryptophan-rich sensory protein [Candidatus ainarchaeum sp.]|nr:tryptophan-rich sensory protein [Candidatus ainarchaeum sp.]MDD5096431.1 tryptophan-rich sensory protein [Candidatus ainarchaeum sp.]